MTDKKSAKEKVPKTLGTLSPFHIEISRTRRGISLIAEGIIGINDFGDGRAVLMSHGGRVIISGKRLCVAVYEHNTVEITGKIDEVGFTYGKN